MFQNSVFEKDLQVKAPTVVVSKDTIFAFQGMQYNYFNLYLVYVTFTWAFTYMLIQFLAFFFLEISFNNIKTYITLAFLSYQCCH